MLDLFCLFVGLVMLGVALGKLIDNVMRKVK